MTEKLGLRYLNRDVSVSVSPYGYYYGFNESIYRGIKIRNRVVARLDIVSGMKRFFTEQTLASYRKVIFDVMSGIHLNKGFLSDLFSLLYKVDIQFKRYLTEVVYESSDLESMSLYSKIVYQDMREEYRRIVGKLDKSLSDSRCIYMFDVDGYYYVAVPDSNVSINISIDCKGEVLSHAEVWNGKFSKNREAVYGCMVR